MKRFINSKYYNNNRKSNNKSNNKVNNKYNNNKVKV